MLRSPNGVQLLSRGMGDMVDGVIQLLTELSLNVYALLWRVGLIEVRDERDIQD